MSESITITIPMQPPRELNPNWHGSWRTKARMARDFRGFAYYATMQSDDAARFDPRGALIMDAEIRWCCGRRTLDSDNAWASLKPARDGIADALFGGEDKHIQTGQLVQVRGDGSVVVTIRRADDSG